MEEHRTLLRLDQIRKSFSNVQALKGVNLELKKGEVLALMGENGAGKSTLMNILQGAVGTYEGDIYLEDRKIVIHSPVDARNLGIAKIHQELQLVPELTVAENIFLGREPRTKMGFVDFPKMNREIMPYLEALDLDIKPTARIKELRLGEQQLIEIAKALSLNARILIMDEPTSALSEAETQKLFQVIRRLSAEGVSIIYISHRMEEIFELTHRITVMRDGEYIATVKTSDVTKDELIQMMVGRSVSDLYPSRRMKQGKEMLSVDQLAFQPPAGSAKKRLTNISFKLHQGEVLGIAGLMGSGRTEILECLFGMFPEQTEGRILLKGEEIQIRSPQEAIGYRMSFVTEDRKGQGLVLGRPIGENMTLPLLKQLSRWFMLRFGDEEALCQIQMDNLKIKAENTMMHVGNLSGGNQQKVVLARWMMINPDILLLDEPTRGIDVGAKAEIYQLIHKLADEGKSIIMVSSELPELIGMCDRMITICEGRVTGEFSNSEATQEKLLAAATLREGE
ncbi:sugar ABC transporter ATP-binding protein [Paenibacillus sp. Root444D2]|uniref:sugar ABC transporter ATP-binding protein n=1 Tax=Paenibacillus sp. Root444D2 TaxID=1736538 RepID=UPI00070F3F2E|nr:sugar ABC transporter ATP-binding protein [Paenibacillus sp. Root444D2]KQX62649.1 D-ribose transporter ATP-binding protein [Paenibacillus sp. Root444D2]